MKAIEYYMQALKRYSKLSEFTMSDTIPDHHVLFH